MRGPRKSTPGFSGQTVYCNTVVLDKQTKLAACTSPMIDASKRLFSTAYQAYIYIYYTYQRNKAGLPEDRAKIAPEIMYRNSIFLHIENVRSAIQHYSASDLVGGRSRVDRPRGVRGKRQDRPLGEVDGSMKSAGRVNQTRQHLHKETSKPTKEQGRQGGGGGQ